MPLKKFVKLNYVLGFFFNFWPKSLFALLKKGQKIKIKFYNYLTWKNPILQNGTDAVVTQRRRSGASNISRNSSSSNRHQWWCHLYAYSVQQQQQQQQQWRRSVDERPTDQPTDDGRTEQHQQQPLVPTYFWRTIRTDMRRDAYKFVHPHLMRSCWTLVNDSQSLSVDVWNLNSRVQEFVYVVHIHTYPTTYCCVTVSAQNLRVYIFSYIYLWLVYLYICWVRRLEISPTMLIQSRSWPKMKTSSPTKMHLGKTIIMILAYLSSDGLLGTGTRNPGFGSAAQWAKTRKKVHFGRTMHCLPQRLRSMFFEFFRSPWRELGVKKKFQRTFSLWGNRATSNHLNTHFKLDFFVF